MAVSRQKKHKALALYIEGMNREQIARDLGVAPSTVKDWYDRNIPEPWDAARKGLEDKARSEVLKKLEEERVKLGTTHYRDFELLRNTWRRFFLEAAPPDPRTGKPPIGTDGKPVMVARTKFSAGEIRFMSSAYRDIQDGQRTIFGQSAYFVGQGQGDGEGVGVRLPTVFLPPETDE